MNLVTMTNIIVFTFAFISFIYGAITFLKPKKALYGKMIVLAMLCIVFGRLFNIVRLLTGGNIYQTFQLGVLGTMGSLLFFFSSNYGTLDSLVDDGNDEYKKYRLMALAAPAVAILLYAFLFLIGNTPMLWKVQGGVLSVFVAFSSYYHLKHLIIPDVDFGVVRKLRPYNTTALIYMVASVLEFYALSRENEVLILISGILIGIFVLAMMVLTIRGLDFGKTKKKEEA
ncbi:hypothetical protein [Eubacterium xylanophilum]|uniref:hypothetical protein n=1 Tax=Eubacterium xylanophilum TaxID=39497 RepID=UPI000478B517|nr:hypothetical protein [Eubacterium xylanophilum]